MSNKIRVVVAYDREEFLRMCQEQGLDPHLITFVSLRQNNWERSLRGYHKGEIYPLRYSVNLPARDSTVEEEDVFDDLVRDLVEGATSHSLQSNTSDILMGTITMLHTLMEMGYDFSREVETSFATGQMSSYHLFCISPDGVSYNSQSNRYIVNAETRSMVADKFIVHIWVTYQQIVAKAALERIYPREKNKLKRLES
jgi:hypothetical protein